MWEYLAILLTGFWLGVALLLYFACYWLDEIFDIPSRSASPSSRRYRRKESSSASSAHAQLKRLVARVVEEAAALPALAEYAADRPRSPAIEASTYEDLLATAILNKVIERYQTENGSGGRSSGIHSASASPTTSERSSPRSHHSHAREITPPLEEEEISDWEDGDVLEDILETPKRVPFPEFGGDIVHKDNRNRDFDEVSGSDIQAADGSWEENWLFQKKKVKTIQSVPVPMLVPNSNTDYRALIGDRDADDTTDLSDNASEAEDNVEYKSDIKRVLESKHVIGGKINIEESMDFEPDSLTIDDGINCYENDEIATNDIDVVDAVNNTLNNENAENNYETIKEDSDEIKNGKDSVLILPIDSGPLSTTEFSLKEEIHRKNLNGRLVENKILDLNTKTNGEVNSIDNTGVPNEKIINNNTISRYEKEGEYEETVALPVQRYADSLRRKHFEDDTSMNPIHKTDIVEDLIPGSIAYRERKKWLNYVEMPNNPYSPEAIQKRLSAKNNATLFDHITNNKHESIQNTTNTINGVTKDVKGQINDFEKELNIKDILKLDTESKILNGSSSNSPSPKILKNVLAEDVPQYKRYGRDYYIKEAKKSSGSRKRNTLSDTSSISSINKSTSLDNFDTEFASPGLLIKQFNEIATNQKYTDFAVDDSAPISATTTIKSNSKEVLIEYEDIDEHSLFSAKPIHVDDDTDEKFEEILHYAYNTDVHRLDNDTQKTNGEALQSPSYVDNSYISTSSMDDSIKVYNVPTGEIVKTKSDDKIIDRYESPSDRNDNIHNVDKPLEETIRDDSEDVNSLIFDELEDEKVITSEIQDILPQLPKVKELAKKFIVMDNLNGSVKPPQLSTKRRKSKEDILNEAKPGNKVYMHSLTARSISKEFRDELKLSLATPLTVPGGVKEVPEGEEVTKESSRPGSPVPEPGTIKTKLAFFESLRNKFNNNSAK